VHAWNVGRILKVPRVLIPFAAGAISAYGLLAAPLAFDFVRTAPQGLDRADWGQVNRLLSEMEAEGREVLSRAGVAERDMAFRRSAEMRYLGQGHEVEAAVPGGPLGPQSLAPVTAAFEDAYRRLYSRTPMGVAIEALNWRVVVSGPAPSVSAKEGPAEGPSSAGIEPDVKKRRRAYFPEAGGHADTPVYDRYALRHGMCIDGPAIIEERESTTIIGPGAIVQVDGRLTLVARLL